MNQTRESRPLLPWLRPPTPPGLVAVVAVLVVVALLGVVWSARQQTPDAARRARLAALAVVEPPTPSPEAIRAGADNASYARGLEAYAAGRWADAIAALGGIDRADARFYRGVAHLMTGDPTTADTLFELVQRGDAPMYAREAVFYRAKAALARGQTRQARDLVADAVRVGAGPPGEAEQLRDALELLR